ncbi:MAG: thiol reductant ABC exporter subunit CydD [Actinomycetota bacterium]|nr:thiol reductant ABC exporter subunit CydD [Actinomycetota bacterium]
MKPVDPRLLKYARSSRGFLVLAILVGMGIAVVVVIQARLLSDVIVNLTTGSASWADVAPTVIALACVFLLRALLNWFAETTAFRSAALAKRELRAAAGAAVLRGGHYGPAGTRPGEMAALLSRGIDGLDAYYARYLPQLVLAVIVPLTILGVVLGADVLSAVILAVTIPLIPLFLALIGMYTQSRVDRQWKVLGQLSGHFLDLVSGLPTLKAFGRAKAQERAIRGIGEEYRSSTMGVLRISFLSSLALELLATVSVALVAVSIGFRLAGGQMEYSTALFVLLLAPEAYLPLRMVGQQFHAAAEGMGAAEQIFALIESAPRTFVDQAMVVGDVRELTVHEVSVSFGEQQALAPISFSAHAGQITALAGPSGAGKSTLLAVIMGLLQPTSGRVSLLTDHRVDQATVSREAWLREIGWVPQFPRLVSASLRPQISLREAVTLGAPAASDDAVWNCLTQAGVVDEFAVDTAGLDRMISVDGSGLSIGQSQRLALARAMIREPRILILDEPTAALDAKSESAVVQALQRAARQGAIVLVVAHRQAMLAIADQVIRVPGRVQ